MFIKLLEFLKKLLYLVKPLLFFKFNLNCEVSYVIRTMVLNSEGQFLSLEKYDK